MSVLLALALSFVTTLVVGFVAAVLLDLFAPLHPSAYGGFCVALGYLLHRASYSGPVNLAALEAFATLIGGVIGLVLFWQMRVRTPADFGLGKIIPVSKVPLLLDFLALPRE